MRAYPSERIIRIFYQSLKLFLRNYLIYNRVISRCKQQARPLSVGLEKANKEALEFLQGSDMLTEDEQHEVAKVLRGYLIAYYERNKQDRSEYAYHLQQTASAESLFLSLVLHDKTYFLNGKTCLRAVTLARARQGKRSTSWDLPTYRYVRRA